MHPSCGTPHRVGGQTMVEDRTKVGTVYRLELVVIRIAAERERRVRVGVRVRGKEWEQEEGKDEAAKYFFHLS